MKRKVAVIMAADVVGYSRLMSENEEKTVHRLMLHRAVFEEHIQRGYGRIFNTAGDAVLAEFPSSVDALRVAVDVQEIIASENEVYSAKEKMLFRIGITVGDVLEKDGDLLGDAVNIAARLEGIAEAGGICVSQAIFEQVAKKVDIKFKSLGGKSVKNIPDKIQVFSVVRGLKLPREIRQINLNKPSRLWIFWTHKKKTAFFAALIVLLAFGSKNHDQKGTPIVTATISSPPIAAVGSPQPEAAGKPLAGAKDQTTPTSKSDDADGHQSAASESQAVLPENASPEEAAKWAETVAPPAPPLPDSNDGQRKPNTESKGKSSLGFGDMAYDWLKSKADAGDAESMNSIGAMYALGVGRDQDESQAIKWFEMAVDHNNTDAMLNLSRIYLDSDSKNANTFEGMRLLRRAVDLKNIGAIELLSELYYSGNYVGQDLSKAIALMRTAADLGNTTAMSNLCASYMNGTGVQKDYGEALKWCQMGADADDAGALSKLGVLYVQGWGVQQDKRKALMLITKAANKGDKDGMRNLGVFYEQGGPDLPIDLKQSFAWYKKAAEAGDSQAMTLVGVDYYKGSGTDKNFAQGKQWLEKAIAAGDVRALYNLGVYYEHDSDPGSKKRAFDLYRQSAEKGDPEGMMMTGVFLYEGRSVPKNITLGLQWLNRSKQAGLLEADAVLQSYRKK